MMTTSSLFVGQVRHRRHKPARHALRYSCFWLLADVDELPVLSRRLTLFSHNRWNIFSLRDHDYGDGSGRELRSYVEAQLAPAGLPSASSTIRLLTMPRILGYAFNPLSIYFCYAPGGTLAATLYEVRNTFGQRHSYLIPVESGSDGAIVQRCAKAFYVSPFLAMDLNYEFRLAAPGEALGVAICVRDAEGPVLTASLAAKRRDLTDRTLGSLLVTHPLLTLKVIAGIHVEALWLLLKGVGLRARPTPPTSAVSLIPRSGLGVARHV
jgi:uncharacterized protein